MSPVPIVLLIVLALAGCHSSPGSGPDRDGLHAAPQRRATTRALLSTSTRNLLLDPFVTADTSWGHFVAVLLPAEHEQYQVVPLRRSFVSQAPGGVASPVVVLAAVSTLHSAAEGMQIAAPFPGGSGPLEARIWVSAGDSAGMPVGFDGAAARLKVALVPNDLPSTVYPLVRMGSPVGLAGREWVQLALPAAVPMPQGGWFSVGVDGVNVTFQLQAPEVVPAAEVGPHPAPMTRLRRDPERAALAAYPSIIHR